MAVAGHIVANLTANTQGWVSGLKAAESPLASFESKLGRFMAMLAGAFGFSKVIQSASDLQETIGKFKIVFAEQADAALRWSDTYSASVGRSRREVMKFMSEAQDLFVPLGFDTAGAAQISQTLTQLSYDLASFNNYRDEDVFANLMSGLLGESVPLKKYGIVANETAVKQELLNMSMDPSKATEYHKVIARMNIMLKMTTAAQGDAIRTGGNWASQWKRLAGVSENLAQSIGSKLLPPLTKGLQLLNSVIVSLEAPLSSIAGWIGSVVSSNTSWLPVLGGTALAILGVVTVMKAITIATMAYAKAQAIATALTGPKGWLILAGAAAAASIATYALSKQQESLNAEMAAATGQTLAMNNGIDTLNKTLKGSTSPAGNYAADIARIKQAVQATGPKHREVTTRIEEMRASWEAASKSGEKLTLSATQLESGLNSIRLSESGFTGMFDDLTTELRVLRGEIDETGLKFEQMAAMGVDERHITKLREMMAERDQLQAKSDEQQKLKEERDQRLQDVRGNIDSFQQGNQSEFGKFKSTVADVQEAIDAGLVQPIEAYRYLEAERQKMLEAQMAKTEIQGQQASNTGVDSRTDQGNQMVLDLINRRTGIDDAAKKEQEERERQSVEYLREIRNAAVANGMKTKPFNQRGART